MDHHLRMLPFCLQPGSFSLRLLALNHVLYIIHLLVFGVLEGLINTQRSGIELLFCKTEMVIKWICGVRLGTLKFLAACRATFM